MSSDSNPATEEAFSWIFAPHPTDLEIFVDDFVVPGRARVLVAGEDINGVREARLTIWLEGTPMPNPPAAAMEMALAYLDAWRADENMRFHRFHLLTDAEYRSKPRSDGRGFVLRLHGDPPHNKYPLGLMEGFERARETLLGYGPKTASLCDAYFEMQQALASEWPLGHLYKAVEGVSEALGGEARFLNAYPATRADFKLVAREANRRGRRSRHAARPLDPRDGSEASDASRVRDAALRVVHAYARGLRRDA